jgi:glutamyl/glutaminyl-tRNA synthetase
MLIWKKLSLNPQKHEITIQMLEKSLLLLADAQKENPQLSASFLRDTFQNACEKDTIHTGELLWPLRAAVSGQERSPDVFEIIEILGYNNTKSRIERAIQKLQTSKK